MSNYRITFTIPVEYTFDVEADDLQSATDKFWVEWSQYGQGSEGCVSIDDTHGLSAFLVERTTP